MKTLVIHGKDASTDFLIPIYKGMHNKTVVTKNTSKADLLKLIESHDRIMMLGHGWTSGLFNISGIGEGGHSICAPDASHLIDKECIFIWCQANTFVTQYGLRGFNTGMFVSEVGEAAWYDMYPTQEEVDLSNNTFVQIFKKHRKEDFETMHKNVKAEYSVLAKTNIVADYNLRRIYNNK